MRTKLLTRVWTTVAAVALIDVVTTWIILENRRQWIVIDDVVLAEALMERIGACTWTNNLHTQTYWTSLRARDVGTEEVWGGYDWVCISNVPAAANAAYNRTYWFSERLRSASPSVSTRIAPDRGYLDSYTSGTYRLYDLGPAGGSARHGHFGHQAAVPVGGWALASTFFLDVPLFLPRHCPLSAGRFLRPVSAAAGAQLASFNMATLEELYDPSVIVVLTGPVNAGRAAYWHPQDIYFATNEIIHLPWTHDSWLDADLCLSGVDPCIISTPVSGQRIFDELLGMIALEPTRPDDRYFCDSAYAASGSSDFSGWTNQMLPALSANASVQSNLAVWTAHVGTPVRSLAAYRALGEAVVDMTSMQITGAIPGGGARSTRTGWLDSPWVVSEESYWTNVVWRRYSSRFSTNDTVSAAVADLAGDAGWTLLAETNMPIAAAVWYELSVGSTLPFYDTHLDKWRVIVRMEYEYAQGNPFAFTGIGHNSNGYHEATAHGWPSSAGLLELTFGVPTGETVVQSPTGQLFAIDRATSSIGPLVHVFETRVPAFVGAPPESFFSGFSDSSNPGAGIGYQIGRPVVAAKPKFDVYDYR